MMILASRFSVALLFIVKRLIKARNVMLSAKASLCSGALQSALKKIDALDHLQAEGAHDTTFLSKIPVGLGALQIAGVPPSTPTSLERSRVFQSKCEFLEHVLQSAHETHWTSQAQPPLWSLRSACSVKVDFAEFGALVNYWSVAYDRFRVLQIYQSS